MGNLTIDCTPTELKLPPGYMVRASVRLRAQLSPKISSSLWVSRGGGLRSHCGQRSPPAGTGAPTRWPLFSEFARGDLRRSAGCCREPLLWLRPALVGTSMPAASLASRWRTWPWIWAEVEVFRRLDLAQELVPMCEEGYRGPGMLGASWREPQIRRARARERERERASERERERERVLAGLGDFCRPHLVPEFWVQLLPNCKEPLTTGTKPPGSVLFQASSAAEGVGRTTDRRVSILLQEAESTNEQVCRKDAHHHLHCFQ